MSDVTVVITLYNKEAYIQGAIQSVLNQSYHNWRLLIIDDASTDRSLQYAQTIKDDRITLIALKKNVGQTHALNYALSLITTPYFIQLDADDWLDSHALLRMMETSKTYPEAALIYGNHMTYWLDEEKRIINKEIIILEQYKDKYDLLLKMNHALVPRCYKTEVVRNIGGWMVQEKGDMLAEDVQIILRLVKDHQWIWINEVLYHRRRDPENLKKFEDTRALRRNYRYNLYNQLLREWGSEYRAKWKIADNSYFLECLIKNTIPEQKTIPSYTIVIPVYNHEKTVAQAVRSALKQTWSPELILIMNDASTDDSLKTLYPFTQDAKVRLISMGNNIGISNIMNVALSYITTPYFIQLDADDWLEANAAERLIKGLHRAPEAAFSFGNHRLWEQNADGTVSCIDQVLQPKFKNKYDFLLELGYMINPRCYRTPCVREVNGWVINDPWNGRYYEDARMIIRLASQYSWVQLNDLLHNVRINRKKSSDKKKYYNFLRVSFYEEILKRWGDQYEPVWKLASTGRIVLEKLNPKK
ncbi:putative glycosyltransferase EpsE [compost metagenome]